MTQTNAPLLVELQTEELPAHQVRLLGQALADNLMALLTEHHIPLSDLEWGATPRRLAVWFKEVATVAPAQARTHKGPPLRIAFDQAGQPTPAALKFAEKFQVSVDQLARVGDYLEYSETQEGATLEAILLEKLPALLEGLPVAKRMRWGSGTHTFIRPIQGLIVLHGSRVYPVEAFGKRAGNTTPGHRFHHPALLTIHDPWAYKATLLAAKVMVDIDARAEIIRKGMQAAAAAQQCSPIVDERLFEEVLHLVEWPVVLLASFDEKFLSLPEEVLITTMMHHQRYFPLRTAEGKLAKHFILITNLDSENPARIIQGNIRVVHARLADAAFFYKTDMKKPLADRVEALKTVVFQKALGTMYERTQRIEALSSRIADVCGVSVQFTARAAHLCKADLLTLMVGEFPELQGIMGRYYAHHDKEAPEVALALEEAYLPRFSKDALPSSGVGAMVALADRLDLVVGFFGIDQRPTGTKDPFGLRRAMLGIVRILLNLPEAIDLRFLLQQSALQYGKPLSEESLALLLEFASDRLCVLFQEQGYSPQVIDAVLALGNSIPVDIALRLEAVQDMVDSPQILQLAATNKRVAKILEKSDIRISSYPPVDTALFQDPQEHALASVVAQQKQLLSPALAQRDYGAGLQALLPLQAPLDAFFEAVMVMDEDISIQRNRLALLGQVRYLLIQIADISCLSR